MGQAVSSSSPESSPNRPDRRRSIDATHETTDETLERFNRLSKTGTGVHMFAFTPSVPKDASDIRYVGSEVTDSNNVLDVRYAQWHRSLTLDDHRQLRPKWQQVHVFSSPRIARVAVMALLNQGYDMDVISDADAMSV